jgi:hypothetical protein
MNNRICIAAFPVLILLFLFSLPGTVFGENYLFHTLDASVLVTDPESSSGEIAGWSEKNGGYYVMKSSSYCIVRFPYDLVLEFKEFLESEADELYSYIPAASDVRNEILFLRSSIESREEILEENLRYLDNTDVSGTLAVEKEVMEILKELEEMKGRLKVLNQNRRFAYAEIDLQFQSQSLPDDVPSSFPWLNSMDLYSLLQRGF